MFHTLGRDKSHGSVTTGHWVSGRTAHAKWTSSVDVLHKTIKWWVLGNETDPDSSGFRDPLCIDFVPMKTNMRHVFHLMGEKPRGVRCALSALQGGFLHRLEAGELTADVPQLLAQVRVVGQRVDLSLCQLTLGKVLTGHVTHLVCHCTVQRCLSSLQWSLANKDKEIKLLVLLTNNNNSNKQEQQTGTINNKNSNKQEQQTGTTNSTV